MTEDERFDYTAYYAQRLDSAAALVVQIRAWAAEHSLKVALSANGRPFIGMSSSLTLEGLSQPQIDEFKMLFKPDRDSAIGML